MSYREQLKDQANLTHTMNGAVTHGSSGDACLDLFAVAGGMRYRKPAEQIRLFDRAYIETPDLAMKLLFHLRDIRQGMGERKLFRTLLRHVAFTWPESARKNAQFVAEYGRWDDLLCLLKTPAHATAVKLIHDQLAKDLAAAEARENGDKDAPISLLAKWLPSENTSSVRTRAQAVTVYQALNMAPREYRAMLTCLRRHIGLTERYLTIQAPEKIDYEAVPAHAMLKYRQAFEHWDGKRFGEYLEAVKTGSKTMHADTLDPHEILRPFFGSYCAVRSQGKKMLNLLWLSKKGEMASRNAISVIDVSGSMYWHAQGTPQPALISQTMGLFCAEHNEGFFRNMAITFESRPHLMDIHGRDLYEKLRYLQSMPCGGSTDLEAVFDLLLDTAIKYKVPQEELPEVLFIFSDMEFNQAMRNADSTMYDNARKRFEAAGHAMPAVVFHNVNSWQMQVPVTAHTRGTALTSGTSVASLKEKFDGNVTPMSHMLRVLNSKRYECICA